MQQILPGTPLYKIKVRFANSTEEFDDVSGLTFFRCPITKTGSFSILTLNIKVHEYLMLYEAIQNHQFPYVYLSINMIADETSNIVINKGCDKIYFAIYCLPLTEVKNTDPYCQVSIFLVHPVLYYMQTTSGYNKILENKTAYDTLIDFETWCEKTFGKCFSFLKIGEQHEKNDFIYQQLQITQPYDLLIPSFILTNYKAFNTFSYYFFDCFNLSRFTNNDITATLINLSDIEKFQPINVSDANSADVRPDVLTRLTKLNMYAVNDPFNKLYQEHPSVIVKGTNRRVAFKKGMKKKKVPFISTQVEEQQYATTKTKYVSSNIAAAERDTTEQTIIYAPDDPQNALIRFNLVSEQARHLIANIQTYYLTDCHYDIIQFCCRYNLDYMYPQEYKYVPISICNSFIRNAGQYNTLTHNVKFQVIKFR